MRIIFEYLDQSNDGNLGKNDVKQFNLDQYIYGKLQSNSWHIKFEYFASSI